LVLKTDLIFYIEHPAGSVALRPLPGFVQLLIAFPAGPLAQNRLLATVPTKVKASQDVVVNWLPTCGATLKNMIVIFC